MIPVNISNHFLLFSLCKEQGPVWRIYLLLYIRSIQVKYPQTEESDITPTFFVTQTFPNQSQDYLVWIPFSLISIIIVILVDVGNWYLDVTQQWLVSCCQSSHQYWFDKQQDIYLGGNLLARDDNLMSCNINTFVNQ